MKIHRACGFAIVLCAVSALAGAQQAMPVRPSPKTAEAEVRRLSAAEVKAFLQKDPKAMDRIWAAEYVVTTPFSKFVKKPQLMEMVTSGVLVITSYDHVDGDTAVVAGSETVILGGKMPNPGKSTELRFTSVWQRKGGRWQEIARHANVVPPAAAAR